MADEFLLRIRGIPWSCSKEEIRKFFSECAIEKELEGIHFSIFPDGKPSGEAYIEFSSAEDVEKAKKKNRNYIGSRYIEVFDATRAEMDQFLSNGSAKRKRGGGDFNGGPRNGGPPPFGGTMPYFEDSFNHLFVRLRGLPFNCKEMDIEKFFKGCEIAPNGIKMPLDRQYKSVGEAFVQFASITDADKAMSKHKDKIGHRYIEVFRSSPQEFDCVYIDGYPPLSMRYPPPGPRGPPNPWMDGFGPRGYGPPPSYAYQPPPPGPQAGYPYPPPWDVQGGYGAPYGGPPTAPKNPYFEDYQPPWAQKPGEAPGPAKTRPPAPNRPTPYEKPDRFHYYKNPNERPNEEDERDNSLLPTPPTPARRSDHVVFVRGLPFHVNEDDIEKFFNSADLNVKPTHIKLIHDNASATDFQPAEAKVEFGSHSDAVKAMSKDKAMLYNRPVDLFLCSKEVPVPLTLAPYGSNGAAHKYNYEYDAPRNSPPKPNEAPSNQVYGSNYSYNVPPSNGSHPASAPPPPPVPSNPAEKSYSFYGMVPTGWQPEFKLPNAPSNAPPAADAGYNYGYSNPYYGYGNYGGYNNAPQPPTGGGPQHTIRKEPINYNSH